MKRFYYQYNKRFQSHTWSDNKDFRGCYTRYYSDKTHDKESSLKAFETDERDRKKY